jgi:hypothetical protein
MVRPIEHPLDGITNSKYKLCFLTTKRCKEKKATGIRAAI